MTTTPDTTNEMFQLAIQLVNQSSRNIFLTGKAGTGKTTFLKYIRENCHKQMAIVAPTGVAAINAGGVTIHSFFQLPFSPFVPEIKGFSNGNEEVVNRHSLVSRLRINSEKKKVMQQLELLIIDEISMVRCDTLDAMDTVLRHIRKRPHESFGGVQVLFIGDMFQLPPVIKDQEWRLLSDFYSGPYFFDSQVIREERPLYIEFNKIYRQSEERFIRVLNQVRNNELNEEGISILGERFQPSFQRGRDEGYIILTTHNDTARNINAIELGKLKSKTFIFKAEIELEFADNAYPADVLLQLKEGSQVMFIKNDSDRSKRYFNGKIGIVTKLEEDKVVVKCKDDSEEIEVSKEKWDNIRYTLNKTSRVMEEDVLGSFTQYPLRLAWAITIHKSQGLTFEKAIIDAGEAFAPGQVYVALSRCTSLGGMVLQSKIRHHSLFTDQRIVEFSHNSSSSGQLQQELLAAKKIYREKLLQGAFDFTIARNSVIDLKKYLSENKSSFNSEALLWIENILEKLNTLQNMASKFHVWLQNQFQQPISHEENTQLQERVLKASSHFVQEITMLTGDLQQSPAVTDSRIHAKEYNDSVKEIYAELALKKFMLQGISSPFDIEAWHKRKKNFVLSLFSVNAYAGAPGQRAETPHPLLHQDLRKLRDEFCSKKDLPIYIVAGSNTVNEMARYLPQTLAELRKISGFGDAKIEQYGQQFLAVILKYCHENGFSSLIHEKLPKRERKQNNGEKKTKVDTKAESFKLYREGMNVEGIAKARNFTIQTIEGHLSHYVSKGEIKIEELVSREKILLIEPALHGGDGITLTSVKQRLGDEIGFGEIRFMIAWKEFQKGLPKEL